MASSRGCSTSMSSTRTTTADTHAGCTPLGGRVRPRGPPSGPGRTAAHDTRSAGPERNAADVGGAWDDAPVSHDFRHRPRVLHRAIVRLGGMLIAGFLVAGVAAVPALAHGPVPADPPTLLNLAFGWSFEPALILPLVAAAWLWTRAVRRINATH